MVTGHPASGSSLGRPLSSSQLWPRQMSETWLVPFLVPFLGMYSVMNPQLRGWFIGFTSLHGRIIYIYIFIYLFMYLFIYLASHLTLTNKNTRRRPAFFVELLELSATSGDGKMANPFGATKPLRTKGPFPSRLRASDRISGEFMMIPLGNVPLVGKTTQKWYHLISSRACWINIGLSAIYLHCKYVYIYIYLEDL